MAIGVLAVLGARTRGRTAVWLLPVVVLAACGPDSSPDDVSEDAGVAGAAGAAGAGAGGGGGASGEGGGPVAMPDTPAAEQLTWLVDALNASAADMDFPEDEFEAHVSQDIADDDALSWFVSTYAAVLWPQTPLTLRGAEPAESDHEIWGQLHAEPSDRWLRLGITVDPEPPHLVTSIAVYVSPDLDPVYGPLGAGELGVQVWDPNGEPAEGDFVEVVDRATGQPLSPPATGFVDAKYSYARLSTPDGHHEVGLKLTHADGQVTYNYGPHLRAGVDLARAASFNDGAFTYYNQKVGSEIESGTAQLWGVLFHEPVPRWRFEADVGCAVVSAVPSIDTIAYTSPPSYLPDLFADRTHPLWSTWFAFNVEVAAYKITAQATGEPLEFELPPLAPDAVTVVWMEFGRATYPQNPTPMLCAP